MAKDVQTVLSLPFSNCDEEIEKTPTWLQDHDAIKKFQRSLRS